MTNGLIPKLLQRATLPVVFVVVVFTLEKKKPNFHGENILASGGFHVARLFLSKSV